MSSKTDAATLSVVVALVSGKLDDLRRCLTALRSQTRAPSEILVPFDAKREAVLALATEFPEVTFVRTDGAPGAHFDVLRTMGLRAAAGDLVALTEDHAHVGPAWCEEMARAVTCEAGIGAAGGAIECDSDSVVTRAVWFCDFWRYQNPIPDARATFVSDSNVIYARAALERCKDAWWPRYIEPHVHGAMTEAGFTFRTTPRAVAWQARGHLALGPSLGERFVWARWFASERARSPVSPSRWLLALLSPLLPVVLTWRIGRATIARGAHTGWFVRLLPAIFLLEMAWAAGECVGYVTASPGQME